MDMFNISEGGGGASKNIFYFFEGTTCLQDSLDNAKGILYNSGFWKKEDKK